MYENRFEAYSHFGEINKPWMLKSAPFPVEFAGFKSTTKDLARRGWEFVIMTFDYNQELQIYIKNEHFPFILKSPHVGYHVIHQRSFRNLVDFFENSHGCLPFTSARDIQFDEELTERISIFPVDFTAPTFTEIKQGQIIRSIKEYFVTVNNSPILTKNIILDQMGMDEVLDLALRKQEPIQKKIQEKLHIDQQLEKIGTVDSKLLANLRLFS